MTRYARPLVILHWVIALFVILALIAGNVLLEAVPNDDPHKVGGLRNHMSLGIVILVLMAVRLIVRIRSTDPDHADAGHPLLNLAAKGVHLALYLLVFAMCLSGIALSGMAGLPGIVFGGSGEALPDSFAEFAPRAAHGIISLLLGLAILAHVAGALYHQLILKDGLMGRMSLRRG